MLRRLYRHAIEDSLYRNSFFMIASAVVMGGLGFFFWLLAAHLFTTEQVGIGSTLISVIGLITGISALGFTASLVRYLPGERRRSHMMMTAFAVTTLTAVIAAAVFLLGLPYFSPTLLFLWDHWWLWVGFIVAMAVLNLFSLIESVFVAERAAEYLLIKNALFSIIKLALLFSLVGLGAYAIFLSWSIAALVGLAAVWYVLIRKYSYSWGALFDPAVLKTLFVFSATSFVAGLLASVPTLILPLLITNKLGPSTTAYYYVAMTFGTLIFTVPRAISNSLFAEGSHAESDLPRQVRKAVLFTIVVLLPICLITFAFGNFLLLIFGREYSVEGFQFLQLLVVSCVFVTVNSIYETVLRVRHRLQPLVWGSAIGSASTIILAMLLLNLGLYGIGIAWICGQAATSMLYFLFDRFQPRGSATASE